MKIYAKRFSKLTKSELYEILKARAEVFVVEQNCAYLDLDGKDENAFHVFMKDDGGLRAYLRVCEKSDELGTAHIGRVLTLKRGSGLGAAILKEGIRAAFDDMRAREIYIEAQTYARGFYEKEGFCAEGEEFLEDGIPHIRMRLKGDKYVERSDKGQKQPFAR